NPSDFLDGEIKYNQPPAEVSYGKLDILFVTDTSESLDEEKKTIVSGLDRLLDKLPADLNFRMAVLPAHATGYHSGRLFRSGSEPTVLGVNQTRAQLKYDLREKFLRAPGEGVTDGGEAGLKSLSRVFSSTEFATAQS